MIYMPLFPKTMKRMKINLTYRKRRYVYFPFIFSKHCNFLLIWQKFRVLNPIKFDLILEDISVFLQPDVLSYNQRFRVIWFSNKKLPIPIGNNKIFNTLISTTNSPPIGMFPAYDEQTVPSIDGTITDPDYGHPDFRSRTVLKSDYPLFI